MRFLCTYLLPKLAYGLVFGSLMAVRLQRLDKGVFSAVRHQLKLQPGVLNAYIHALAKCGGLGIASLSVGTPSLDCCCLIALQGSSWEVRQLDWCDRATPTLVPN